MKKLFNFNEFISHVNETNENELFDDLISEGFDSSILQSMVSNSNNGIGKKFFDTLSKMGIASSEITNLDMKVIPTADAAKYTAQHPNEILIYYSNREKTNPFAGKDVWRDLRIIQADIVLAVVKGKTYQGLDYDRYASKKPGPAQYKIVSRGDGSIGIDKNTGSYGSGLNTLKKIADVTDIVYAIDPTTVASSNEKRLSRKESKEGAVSFINNTEFKKANQARYEEILSTRAVNSDVDGIVQKAINELTDQIKEGLVKGLKGKYGDLIIGNSPKNREVKMSDATNLMNNILSDYGRYANNLADAEKSKEMHGDIDSYYLRSAKQYAKSIKDYCAKIPTFNYAW
tara:strand:+ start:4682 stop:5713 length:1032 start_codon:yes stop_codon:yes gene_type:complete